MPQGKPGHEASLGRGRERKPVICVSGMAGCGKSTVSRRLAERYGLRYLSGGDALKALAVEAGCSPGGTDWWETEEGSRFLQRRAENPEFDKKVDEKLMEWAGRGGVVLDSWTMPWLLKEGFKVWLEASPEERARRVARRDRIGLKAALRALRERDRRTREIYRGLYGFELGEDLSPFHLVLDTDGLGADEVFRILCLVIDRLCRPANHK